MTQFQTHPGPARADSQGASRTATVLQEPAASSYLRWPWFAPQKPSSAIRRPETVVVGVDLELRVLLQEFASSRASTGAWPLDVTVWRVRNYVHNRIEHDDIAAWLDQGRVHLKFLSDVFSGMIGIQRDDDRSLVTNESSDSLERPGVG